MFTTVQTGLLGIQKRVLETATAERLLYTPAQGSDTTTLTAKPFNLEEAVQSFLNFEEKNLTESKGEIKVVPAIVSDPTKVLLLLSGADSDKNLFCQHLNLQLWRSYHERKPISLLISLSGLKNPIEHAIEETLQSYGFSEDQIRELKRIQRFIFILDGYDQLHQFKNLYVSNRLSEWQAKVIITCRSEYLSHNANYNVYLWLLKQIYMALFTKEQILESKREVLLRVESAKLVTITHESKCEVEDEAFAAKI